MEACWAHNPEVVGSKPISAILFFQFRTCEVKNVMLFSKVFHVAYYFSFSVTLKEKGEPTYKVELGKFLKFIVTGSI